MADFETTFKLSVESDLAELNKDLVDLKKKVDNGTASTEDFEKITDKTEKTLKKSKKEVNDVSQALKQQSAEGIKNSRSWADIAGQLNVYMMSAQSAIRVASQIGNQLVALTKSATEFETSIADLTSINVAREDADALAESLRQLSRDTGASVAGLMKDAYNVISAGAADATNAITLLTATTKGSIGVSTDSSSMLKAVTAVINGMGIAAEDAGRIMDGFQKSIQLGVFTGEQLANELPKVTASAAALGIEYETLMTMLAAGTQISTDINATTTQMGALFTATASNLDKLRDSGARGIDFATGQIQDMGEYLESLRDKTMPELIDIFGRKEAVDAVNSLKQTFEETSAAFSEGLEGAMTGAFDKMADTTAHRLNVLRANMEDMKLTVGEMLIPFVEIGMQIIKDIMPALQDGLKLVSESIKDAMSVDDPELFADKIEDIARIIIEDIVPTIITMIELIQFIAPIVSFLANDIFENLRDKVNHILQPLEEIRALIDAIFRGDIGEVIKRFGLILFDAFVLPIDATILAVNELFKLLNKIPGVNIKIPTLHSIAKDFLGLNKEAEKTDEILEEIEEKTDSIDSRPPPRTTTTTPPATGLPSMNEVQQQQVQINRSNEQFQRQEQRQEERHQDNLYDVRESSMEERLKQEQEEQKRRLELQQGLTDQAARRMGIEESPLQRQQRELQQWMQQMIALAETPEERAKVMEEYQMSAAQLITNEIRNMTDRLSTALSEIDKAFTTENPIVSWLNERLAATRAQLDRIAASNDQTVASVQLLPDSIVRRQAQSLTASQQEQIERQRERFNEMAQAEGLSDAGVLAMQRMQRDFENFMIISADSLASMMRADTQDEAVDVLADMLLQTFEGALEGTDRIRSIAQRVTDPESVRILRRFYEEILAASFITSADALQQQQRRVLQMIGAPLTAEATSQARQKEIMDEYRSLTPEQLRPLIDNMVRFGGDAVQAYIQGHLDEGVTLGGATALALERFFGDINPANIPQIMEIIESDPVMMAAFERRIEAGDRIGHAMTNTIRHFVLNAGALDEIYRQLSASLYGYNLNLEEQAAIETQRAAAMAKARAEDQRVWNQWTQDNDLFIRELEGDVVDYERLLLMQGRANEAFVTDLEQLLDARIITEEQFWDRYNAFLQSQASEREALERDIIQRQQDALKERADAFAQTMSDVDSAIRNVVSAIEGALTAIQDPRGNIGTRGGAYMEAGGGVLQEIGRADPTGVISAIGVGVQLLGRGIRAISGTIKTETELQIEAIERQTEELQALRDVVTETMRMQNGFFRNMFDTAEKQLDAFLSAAEDGFLGIEVGGKAMEDWLRDPEGLWEYISGLQSARAEFQETADHASSQITKIPWYKFLLPVLAMGQAAINQGFRDIRNDALLEIERINSELALFEGLDEVMEEWLGYLRAIDQQTMLVINTRTRMETNLAKIRGASEEEINRISLDGINDQISLYEDMIEMVGPDGELVYGELERLEFQAAITDLLLQEHEIMQRMKSASDSLLTSEQKRLLQQQAFLRSQGRTDTAEYRDTTAALRAMGVGSTGLSVPSFDSGGFIDRDMLANVHAGEYVLNRADMTELGKMLSVGGSAMTINNTFVLPSDMREIGRFVLDTVESEFKRYNRQATIKNVSIKT